MTARVESSRVADGSASPPCIHADELSFAPVDAALVPQLRALNAVLFSMAYGEAYYRSVLVPGNIARLVRWRGAVVGTLSCRVQRAEGADRPEVYVMTFGVLAPYRRLGVGSAMLRHIVECYSAIDVPVAPFRLVLHVHTANTAAVQFYARHGFRTLATLPDYYPRLSPPSAHLLVFSLSSVP